MPDTAGADPSLHLNFGGARAQRIGIAEAILAEPKPLPPLVGMVCVAHAAGQRKLITRLTAAQHEALPDAVRADLDYCAASRVAYLGSRAPAQAGCKVAVVTAGTSDAGPAPEAQRVLRWSGIRAPLVAGAGVAGLGRLLECVGELRQADVLIVCAGMDAALPNVVAGFVPGSVIVVPTSAGYGVAQGGMTALHATPASCAPGLLVVDIDNGYGAPCAARRMAGRRRASGPAEGTQ